MKVEFYNLLGSCGGVLGGWAAVERPQEGHLLPLFVCYDLCNPSPWSRAKVIMTFKRKSKSRMGMRPSDERSNYESRSLMKHVFSMELSQSI
ncbi:hypothetical protein Taro_041961 [Colocasia esculenta]|uniref:Uncharacterized protein n=1 Tax=Colocasia esculenta TaxID=4460 RepID=A0A843WMS3_COLES|nr:hypothetical protein [Colocasia esculenta]